jgi:hypothetical protein
MNENLIKDCLNSWPLAVFLIACVIILTCKDPLRKLIDRIARLKYGGLEMEGLPLQSIPNTIQLQGTKSEIDSQIQQRIKILEQSPYPLILNDQEKLIKNEIEALKMTPEKAIEILTKQLAIAQISYAFELAYTYIFGSQINLLKTLNTNHRNSGLNREEIQSFYKNVCDKLPIHAEKDLDRYLQYLFFHKLITNDNNKICITKLGVEFLSWLSLVGKNENTPN